MPVPPLSYRIQTGFRNAPTAPALLYSVPSGPFLPPHTRLLPEAYQALHPVSVIRLSIYGKLRKLSKLLSLSYTHSLFLPSGIRAEEKFCLLFIPQSQRGNPAKNIHAARNNRRTAVLFPTVLFMDFFIGIHNSMLNCDPYHTVCNIKKQRDHTGPDGQCHKDSKQSSNHIHMHFLLQYIIFVWYISIIACFYILLPYFFITKRQRITFLPLP